MFKVDANTTMIIVKSDAKTKKREAMFKADANTTLIWNYLSMRIDNKNAVAGLVGALYFVSKCNPEYGVKNYSEFKEYTSAGEAFMKRFVHDRKGFGIARWKKWPRKQSLFNLARKNWWTVNYLDAQLALIMDEFSGTTYGPVLEKLSNVSSPLEAMEIVLNDYLDISKKVVRNKRDQWEKLGDEVLQFYCGSENVKERVLKVPKKFISTNRADVRVLGEKKSRFPFARKRLGYLNPDNLYEFISERIDGKEYAIHFGGEIGYVKSDKVFIRTRMEELK